MIKEAFLVGIFALFCILNVSAEEILELVNDPALDNIKKSSGTWQAFSPQCHHSSPGRDAAGSCLLIDVSDNNLKSLNAWQYNTPYDMSWGQGKISVTFWAKTENIKSLNPAKPWSSPSFMLIGHSLQKGEFKYDNFKGMEILQDSSDWKEYRLDFTLPRETQDLAAVFRLKDCTGKIWIDDFSMKFIPATENDKKMAVKIKVMGGKDMTLLYSPRADKADSPLKDIPEKYIKKGFIVFHRANPRDLYPDSIPQADEITESVSLFATPGEYEPAWLAVYPLKELKNFKIDVSDLKDADGNIIPKECIRVLCVKSWRQGSTASAAGDDSVYSIIPELLAGCDNLNIPPRESQNFYFLAKIPENAKPGFYNAGIRMGSNDSGFSEAEICIRVLPFKLRTPENMNWLVHTTGNFTGLIGKEKTLAEAATEVCRDMKAHGIEGISVGCGYGKTISFQKTDDGFKIASFPQLETLIPAMKKANMKGPLIIHFGDMLEYRLAQAMGFELPQGGQKGGVTSAMQTPEFENTFKAAIKKIDELVKSLGGNDFKWYFEGVDEPGGHSGRQDRALWEWRLAKEAGQRGAAYMHGAFWKKLAPYNYVQIFNKRMFYDRETTEKLNRELNALNNVAYQYGASGTYGPLPGGLMPSRWGTGFFAYVTEIKGQISWLYSLSSKADPAKTDHMSFYPLITYVTEQDGLCSTLQWEGIREGIDDYKYLSTLDFLISKAKASSAARGMACDIESKRDLLLSAVPWSKQWNFGDDAGKADLREFDNAAASILRWQIALWIMELESKLKEAAN